MADISKITLPNNGGTYNFKDAAARQTAQSAYDLADSIVVPVPATASPLSDNSSAVVGTSAKYAREDHVHPTDTSRAPTSHASTATTYGVGSSSNYGHVKLSDAHDSTSSTSGGIAATPKAVKDAYDLAASKTSNTGTVTSISTGVGLTGGTISTSGEIKAKLKSETALTVDSAAGTVVSGKVYSVVPDKSGNLAVAVPWDNAVTYSQGTGITISGTTITNSGVRSVSSGSSNGTISVNTNGTSENVAVTGLGSAAFTDSTAYLASSLKGANSGVAELDASGHVPTSQLPSYVDDVLEYTNKASFPTTGETGKIYVDKATNLVYRWSGSAYVEISASLALGTTSSTAFRGDYGQSAYTHAVTNKGSAFASGLYKITTNSEGHVTAATAVQKSDITGLGIPGSDTTYSDATTSTHGLMSTSDKSKLNGIAEGAEVNQNAFSNVLVDGVTIAADAKTDTLELVGGSKITLTADATNDKVTIDAVGNYGVCSTAADVAAKEVTITGLTVETGVTIHVLFTNSNSAASPTLSVNGTTAKPMYQYGTTAFSTTVSTTGWYAGAVVTLTYNGTGWIRDQGFNTNNTYSSMTAAEITAGTGTSARTITPANLKTAINTWGLTDVAYDSTNAKLTKTVNGATSDVFTVDAGPVQNSKNPIQSGGVYTGFSMLAGLLGNDPLNTTAQTIVGALNELDGEVGTINTTLNNLNLKEDKSNKVTSISSSSTDTQYPSAKCVYDIIGDIETALAALR